MNERYGFASVQDIVNLVHEEIISQKEARAWLVLLDPGFARAIAVGEVAKS